MCDSSLSFTLFNSLLALSEATAIGRAPFIHAPPFYSNHFCFLFFRFFNIFEPDFQHLLNFFVITLLILFFSLFIIHLSFTLTRFRYIYFCQMIWTHVNRPIASTGVICSSHFCVQFFFFHWIIRFLTCVSQWKSLHCTITSLTFFSIVIQSIVFSSLFKLVNQKF